VELVTRTVANGCEFILSGRFTFADQKSVAGIRETLAVSDVGHRYILDLENIEFIDSAALGMLLVLQEDAAARDAEIILRKPREKIMKVFKACKYDVLFNIKD